MLSKVLIKNGNGDYVNYSPADNEKRGANLGEVIRPLPADKGKGYFSTILIRKELEFGVSRCKFDEDYSAKVTWPKPSVCFGFCISGQTLSWNSCHPTQVAMTPGNSYVHFFEDPVLERRTSGRQDLQSLVIRVSPEYLLDLLDPNRRTDAQSHGQLVKGLRRGSLFFENVITPEMKAVLFQVFNNPHSGQVGRIYLESKALELIAFQLEQMAGVPDQLKNPFMSAEDKDSIHYARELLINDLQFPPSLTKLAKQVGMPHTRLNRGFKKVFGCTVFEYLRKERLLHVRKLIEEDPVDLTRIALESGFCSSSHMATSFYKEYGIKPSEYRRTLCK
ncbi:helix-turn-helix domain-containing protein [Desulfogranum japonicum]|uniref:helix-turn-helix domain-containing protein n=1 Tax=Desulfogranum japonicum TaxID=231447 RepID=UPI00040F4DFE|nr:AraC family transcriptional regulator [Desulfogranum japonicum]